MSKKIVNYLKYLPLFISSCLIILLLYVKTKFALVDFDEILYGIINTEGSSASGIVEGAWYTLYGGSILFVILLLLLKYLNKSVLKYGNIILVIVLVVSFYSIGMFSYIINQFRTSTLYEDYYVNPNDVEIIFPDDKQNLIYIFLESTETSNVSKKNGGVFDISYMPYLEKLALENINFSNTNKLGGITQVYGTGYTIAGMISQTSGINYKMKLDKNILNYKNDFKGLITIGDILEDNGYDKYASQIKETIKINLLNDNKIDIANIENRLNYLLTIDTSDFISLEIGDILEYNGYNNYLMMGSSSKFAHRDTFFKEHGNYEILDYDEALDTGKLEDNYFNWWGYEDSKLYDYAKEKLTEIANNNNKPFNLTMLTVNTHFTDGYLENSCTEEYDSKYASVFLCEDKMLEDFITWIKTQNFYDNTTIILVGDHLTMQSSFYNKIDKNYKRVVYDVIINSKVDTDNSKNRLFTSMDMFPTTLASLGVAIEGNRLALGTNLYSDKKTLLEELGEDKLNNSLSKKSNYYDKEILKIK